MYQWTVVDDVLVETLRFCLARFHLVTCWMNRVDEHHKQQVVFDSQMTMDLTLGLNLEEDNIETEADLERASTSTKKCLE